MYRDSTAGEKTAWEKKYPNGNVVPTRTERTPLYESAGAVFNDRTGYYELNGMTDITEAEMALIYSFGRFSDRERLFPIAWSVFSEATYPRTTLPSLVSDASMTLIGWCKLETIHFTVSSSSVNPIIRFSESVAPLGNFIKAIYDYIQIDGNWLGRSDWENRALSDKLTEVYVVNLNHNLNVTLPNLTNECVEFMIDRATNTSPISITFAPEVYDRLTESIFTKAYDKSIHLVRYDTN